MSEAEQNEVNFNFVRMRASELLQREMALEGFGPLPISWADSILTELLSKDSGVEDANLDSASAKLLAALVADGGDEDEDN